MKSTGATKEATGHSPLPWKVVEHDFICSGESTVAELTYCPQPKDERRANAQLIVTAVNERERLREALRDLVECSPCRNGCAPDDMTCATMKARVVLNEAPKE